MHLFFVCIRAVRGVESRDGGGAQDRVIGVMPENIIIHAAELSIDEPLFNALGDVEVRDIEINLAGVHGVDEGCHAALREYCD